MKPRAIIAALVAALTIPATALAGIATEGEVPPMVNGIVAGHEGGFAAQHGSAGDAVKVYGHGFTGAAAVTFGEVPAIFTVQAGGTEIVTTAPAGTGTVDVRVSNPAGASAESGGDRFTYDVPAPPAVAHAPSSVPAIVSTPAPVVAATAPAIASAPKTLLTHPNVRPPRHRHRGAFRGRRHRKHKRH